MLSRKSRDIVGYYERRYLGRRSPWESGMSFERSGRRAQRHYFDQSRRDVLKGGALTAGALLLPWAKPRYAHGQTVSTFDYYISQTGSAGNPGTLASPWDISVLSSTPNSGTAKQFQSLIAGKRIGILPGTYNVYSYCQSGSYQVPALSIRGGSSGSPTYIGSCDSSGNYSQGTATITALNPSTGSYPTTQCGIIGQGDYDAGGATGGGYLTIDGLVVTGAFQYGILFFGTYGPSKSNNQGGYPGISVLNCEVYNIMGVSAGNVAGVLLWYTSNALVHNCSIHDIMATDPSKGGAAIIMFNTHGSVIEYSTIFNCYNGINSKAAQNGLQTVRYCYIEPGANFGNNAYTSCLQSFGTAFSGQSGSIHHNILVSRNSTIWDGSTEGLPGPLTSMSAMSIYNNTVVDLGNGFNPQGIYFPTWGEGNGATPPAQVSHFNNIYCATGAPGYLGDIGFSANTSATPNAVALSDFNCFQASASTGAELVLITTTGAGAGTGYSLSAWRANPNGYLYSGVDAHSIAIDPKFVSATSLNPAGYKLGSGSPCAGNGRVGGLSTGSSCDMGAWGYDPDLGGAPSQIGCNFKANPVAPTPVPDAPTLSVS